MICTEFQKKLLDLHIWCAGWPAPANTRERSNHRKITMPAKNANVAHHRKYPLCCSEHEHILVQLQDARSNHWNNSMAALKQCGASSEVSQCCSDLNTL